MSTTITITQENLIEQAKISDKLSELVEELLNRKIITDTAEKADILVTTEELQQEADQYRLRKQLHDEEETYIWLEKQSLSLEDFEALIKYNLLTKKVMQHLFLDQVEPYFFEHQLDYLKAVIYEVILEDEEEAMDIFYELQEAEITFAEVAHKYIKNPELRRKGGYRGIVTRQELKPDIAAAVFASQPSQLLKPILTYQGIHLVFVEEIIQPKLDNIIAHQIASQLFYEWLKLERIKLDWKISL